jgi:hypothetical protein
MTSTVQIGTVLIRENSIPADALGLKTEPYSGIWNILSARDGDAIDSQIHVAGWNFFFFASKVSVMFLGKVGATKIRNALKRIMEKVAPHNFNCIEVTGIAAKHFLGVPYVSVSAHSRHIQPTCKIDSVDIRRNALTEEFAIEQGIRQG